MSTCHTCSDAPVVCLSCINVSHFCNHATVVSCVCLVSTCHTCSVVCSDVCSCVSDGAMELVLGRVACVGRVDGVGSALPPRQPALVLLAAGDVSAARGVRGQR